MLVRAIVGEESKREAGREQGGPVHSLDMRRNHNHNYTGERRRLYVSHASFLFCCTFSHTKLAKPMHTEEVSNLCVTCGECFRCFHECNLCYLQGIQSPSHYSNVIIYLSRHLLLSSSSSPLHGNQHYT